MMKKHFYNLPIYFKIFLFQDIFISFLKSFGYYK